MYRYAKPRFTGSNPVGDWVNNLSTNSCVNLLVFGCKVCSLKLLHTFDGVDNPKGLILYISIALYLCTLKDT